MPGESRSELLADHTKLFAYLSQHLDDMQQVLDEEVVFCNRDVDASMDYTEQMEKQFQMQIQQLKTKLESIRKDNSELFKSQFEQLKHVSEAVDELHQAGKYSEGLWESLWLRDDSICFFRSSGQIWSSSEEFSREKQIEP